MNNIFEIFSDYLEPDNDVITGKVNFSENPAILYNNINFFTPEEAKTISKPDICIIGVPALKKGEPNEKNFSTIEIRKELYNLFKINKKIKILDAGNIKAGNTQNDTFAALTEVVDSLYKKSIIPIIFGCSNNLAYPVFKAYEKSVKSISITSIDSKLRLEDDYSSNWQPSYLRRIITEKSSHLFNFSNLAFQSYMVSPTETDLINSLFFDSYRLGVIRSDIREMEPVIRDSEIVNINLSSLKNSDSPANPESTPNGLTGDEICQLSWYAGMTDKINTLCINGYHHTLDIRNQTAKLISHIIWHFIEGYYNRKNDQPLSGKSHYLKYIVPINEMEQEIVFYKSTKTDRWWMIVPHPSGDSDKDFIASCSPSDYDKACLNEIPDRWWKLYQKF